MTTETVIAKLDKVITKVKEETIEAKRRAEVLRMQELGIDLTVGKSRLETTGGTAND